MYTHHTLYRISRSAGLASLLLTASLLPVRAERAAAQPSSDLIVLSGGWIEVLDDKRSAFFATEYRFRENFRGLHPGLIIGGSSHARYAGAALSFPVDLSPRWRLTLSSGAGYYHADAHGPDLGHSLEFFSNAEISAHVGRGYRVGLSFGHLSNASLSDDNPGTETLRLTVGVPIARWRH